MQFRKFFFLLLASLLLFGISPLSAQIVISNEGGEKIIVYPDASWRYYDLSPDSLSALAANNEGYLEEEHRGQSIEYAEMARMLFEKATREAEECTFQRIFLEEDLQDMKEDASLGSESEIQALEQKIKVAKEKEDRANKKQKEAGEQVELAEKMINMDRVKREKVLLKWFTKQIEETASEEAETPPAPSGDIPDYMPEEDRVSTVKENQEATSSPTPSSEKTPQDFAPLPDKDDVIKHPPAPACIITFEGKDEFTGKIRKDVAPQTFFTHTHKRLRTYFKEKDYISCKGYLTQISGGIKFLTLNFTIASATAQREFGTLEKGSRLNILLINGTKIKLINRKSDSGLPNPLDKTVSYRGEYLLSTEDEKLLEKYEVDKVRVIWGTGYEDYEVYEMDFFINQLNCLNANAN